MGSDFEGHNEKYSSRSSSYSSSESFQPNQALTAAAALSKPTSAQLTNAALFNDMPLNFLLQQSANNNNNNNALNSQFQQLSNFGENLISEIQLNHQNSVTTDSLSSLASQYNHTATLPSSCSQIFANAATFNISQNDTVMFARESIYLIAKFLANHAECTIFRSMYTYAPDNLSWLWSFIDWETPIDFKRAVPTQEKYEPFKWTNGQLTVTHLSADCENLLNKANKIFADSPLVQYKYREKVMIGDLCKFIEHVHKVIDPNIAKSLFSLYFPRFSNYIDNPLKKYLNVKILAANLIHVQELDNMILKLIHTRYNDLNEYKQKILTRSNLPSYVESLIYENDFLMNPKNKSILIGLINDVQFQKKMKEINSLNLNNYKLATSTPALTTSLLNSFLLNQQNGQNTTTSNASFNNSNNSTFLNQSSSLLEQSQISNKNYTSKYLKNLEKVKINKDLDNEIDLIQEDDNETSFDAAVAAVSAAAADNCCIVEPLTAGGDACDLDERNSATDEEVNQLNLMQNLSQLNIYSPTHFESKVARVPSATTAATTTPRQHLGAIASPRAERSTSTNSSNGSSTKSFQNANNNNNNQQSYYCGTIDNGNNVYNNNQRSTILSPTISSFTSRILDNTPRTPTLSNQNDMLWSSNQNMRASQPPIMTPPPSASMHKKLSMFNNENSSNNNDSQLFMSPLFAQADFNSHFDQLANNNYANQQITQEDIQMAKQLLAKQQQQHYQNQSLILTSPRGNNNKYNGNNDYNGAASNSFSTFNDHQARRFNNNNNNNNDLFFNKPLNINTVNNNNNNNHFAALKSPQPNNKGHNNNQQSYFNNYDASTHMSWCGRLPPKIYALNSIYSRKVFLGGLPWDVNQQCLLQMLNQYGQVKLEIPGKDLKHPRVSSKTQERNTPGYIYIIFENEASVQRLLSHCRKELKNGGEHFYYNIAIPTFNNGNSQAAIGFNNNNSFRQQNNRNNLNNGGTVTGIKTKEVEVIPWNQEDTSYVPQSESVVLPSKIDSKLTIFVGALHGMLNAQGLAKVMSEVFGEVIHAGLDTDKYKYPIGSGRVTFRNRASYVKAIKSKFVTIKANLEVNDPSPKFEKTIQIDPYLEDAKCCKCQSKSQFFCRNEFCLDYYCHACWNFNHDRTRGGDHQGLSRQNKATNHF